MMRNMAHGTLLLLTGSPGCGKTTVAPLVADRHSPSACLDLDWFFAKLRRGAIGRGGEAHTQNRVGAARRRRGGGRVRRGRLLHRGRGHPVPVHARSFAERASPDGSRSTTPCCERPSASCSGGSRTAGPSRCTPARGGRWCRRRPVVAVRAHGVAERHRVDSGTRARRSRPGDRPPAGSGRVPPVAVPQPAWRAGYAAAKRCLTVQVLGVLVELLRTCLPNVSTASWHSLDRAWTSTACRRRAGRRRSSAKRWIASATSSGSPTAISPPHDRRRSAPAMAGDDLRPLGDARRPGEGVEVPEHEAQVVVRVGVEERLAGLGAVLQAHHLGGDHDVVVDVARPPGSAVLDLLLVLLDERGEACRACRRRSTARRGPARAASSKVLGLPAATHIGGWGLVYGLGSTLRSGMEKNLPS